jgi:hypothetical protein
VPHEAVVEIARTIDGSGLLCLTPLARAGYQVIDLGRYSITVESTGYTKEVFAGQCYYVQDSAAFNQVLNVIYELESHFGERFSWGAYGTTTVPRPCSQSSSS